MTLLNVRTHHLRRRACTGAAASRFDVAATLARAELPDPAGLWFIDRIDVHAAGLADLGADAAGDLLARQIARAVQRVVDGGPHQDGVRWFPDRAAYLAQWLTDLGAGRTSGRWEYSHLSELRFSPAVRDRAAAEPAWVLAALRSLPAGELDLMIDRLDPADAGAVMHALCSGTGVLGSGRLANIAADLQARARLPRDPRRATLAIVVHSGEPAPSPADAAAARDLAELARALHECDPALRPRLVAAVRAADARELAALGHEQFAVSLARWSGPDRDAALAALVPDTEPRADPEHTRLGGLFVLLPLLAELPLAQACAGWPAVADVVPEQLVAALTIGAALGVGTAVLADPWARLALALPPAVETAVVAWSRAVTTEHADGLAAALAPLVQHRELARAGDLAEPSLLLDPPLAVDAAEAVRVAAGLLLRELSHRLPGMALAGVDHLRRNALALDARVDADETVIRVELGSAPLQVLLSLTGMNRRRFTLPATGDRPWVLTSRS